MVQERVDRLEQDMEKAVLELKVEMEKNKNEIIKWVVGLQMASVALWITSILAFIFKG